MFSCSICLHSFKCRNLTHAMREFLQIWLSIVLDSRFTWLDFVIHTHTHTRLKHKCELIFHPTSVTDPCFVCCSTKYSQAGLCFVLGFFSHIACRLHENFAWRDISPRMECLMYGRTIQKHPKNKINILMSQKLH